MIDAVYLTSLVNNTEAERKPQIDYPGGANLFFIVVALVLSVFLSSLDIVCSCLLSSESILLIWAGRRGLADY